MLSTIISYVLGIVGIILGFFITEGIANNLEGTTYCLLFIPILLLGSSLLGSIGFGIGYVIGK